MEPISRYYLGRDGKLHLKSKWHTRIKILLSTLLTITSLTYIEPSLSSPKHTYVTAVAEKNYYEDYIRLANPKLDYKEVRQIVKSALTWSKEFNLDVKILLAVAKIESNFNKHSISTSGAYGIMQVIPVWHKDKILDARKKLGNPEVFNVDTNMYLGARVLKDCYDKFKSTDGALSCYSGNTSGYADKVKSVYVTIKNWH